MADSYKNEAKVDENILTALKAKNYGVQFSDLYLDDLYKLEIKDPVKAFFIYW